RRFRDRRVPPVDRFDAVAFPPERIGDRIRDALLILDDQYFLIHRRVPPDTRLRGDDLTWFIPYPLPFCTLFPLSYRRSTGAYTRRIPAYGRPGSMPS